MTSIVITGANTGIGRATAEGIASPGVELVLAGRSLERTQPVIDAVRAKGATAEFVELDLGSLASIRKVVEALESRPRIDVLINNAGVGGVHGQTSDGFELHVGINHLGHFALTTGLLDKLAADKARVVCVASDAHYRARALDFETFEHPTATRTGWREYCVSKLCNVLFAAELARRYGSRGVFAVSLHPGVIASDLWRHLPAPARLFAKLFMTSTADGARTSIHCASAALEAGLNGGYFAKAKPKRPSRLARDAALAGELWERSAKMVAR